MTKLTLTVDVLSQGEDFTLGMVVGLLRGAGVTVTDIVVNERLFDPGCSPDWEREKRHQQRRDAAAAAI